MEFYPTNEYREVTLQAGLNSVQLGNTDKLFSDGLEEYEYIYFDDSKGFCYELESDDKRYSFEGGTGHSIRIYDKETDIGYVGHFEPIKYDADGNATNL